MSQRAQTEIRRPLAALVVACAFAAASPYASAHASAQQGQVVPVDRWLVTSGELESGANMPSPPAVGVFPDRDLEVGPGVWRLVRQDGQERFDFTDLTEAGASTFAHAYLDSAEEADVRLSMEAPDCATVAAWLNGQSLPRPSAGRDVRLAAGWNRLLVVLHGPASCDRSLAVTMREPVAPVDREQAGVGGVTIQASKPPGVRPNYPNGAVTVSAPLVSALSWNPGANDLAASFSYELTSWGRGTAVSGSEDDGRSGPPTVDLTGDWNLTLFGPTGIQRLTARLEMDETGELAGELRVDERDFDDRRSERQSGGVDAFEGNIREGWVSGRRFSWTLTTELMRRRVEIEFRGAFEAGKLRGTLDLGRLREAVGNAVESRFEGTPDDETGPTDLPEDETSDDARPEDRTNPAFASPFEVPRAAAAGQGPGDEDPTGPTDPNGLRAQMIRQLRGRAEPRAPAPMDGAVRLRVAGETFEASTGALAPAVPVAFDGQVRFQKLRDAALDEDGLRAKVEWDGGDLDGSGRLPARAVLVALHGPIRVGLTPGADGISQAELRVPDAFAGFSLRGLGEGWVVDGQPVVDGLLCSPCERGRRLVVGHRGASEAGSYVQIVESGLPGLSAGADEATAVEWLRALEGDNRRYRQLSGG